MLTAEVLPYEGRKRGKNGPFVFLAGADFVGGSLDAREKRKGGPAPLEAVGTPVRANCRPPWACIDFFVRDIYCSEGNGRYLGHSWVRVGPKTAQRLEIGERVSLRLHTRLYGKSGGNYRILFAVLDDGEDDGEVNGATKACP